MWRGDGLSYTIGKKHDCVFKFQVDDEMTI